MKCTLKQHNMEVVLMPGANGREYRKCTHCDFKWYADGNQPEEEKEKVLPSPVPEKPHLFDMIAYPIQNKWKGKYKKIG